VAFSFRHYFCFTKKPALKATEFPESINSEEDYRKMKKLICTLSAVFVIGISACNDSSPLEPMQDRSDLLLSSLPMFPLEANASWKYEYFFRSENRERGANHYERRITKEYGQLDLSVINNSNRAFCQTFCVEAAYTADSTLFEFYRDNSLDSVFTLTEMNHPKKDFQISSDGTEMWYEEGDNKCLMMPCIYKANEEVDLKMFVFPGDHSCTRAFDNSRESIAGEYYFWSSEIGETRAARIWEGVGVINLTWFKYGGTDINKNWHEKNIEFRLLETNPECLLAEAGRCLEW
jgi:hypothetical protein